jgi:hypothetical protein
MDAVLLLAALTAINLAAFVLLDLLTGPASWGRKAGWAILVIGLPLLGAVLCYRHGPAAAAGRGRRRTAGRRRAPAMPPAPDPDPSRAPDAPAPRPRSEIGSPHETP